ncbi:hypothetical protein ACQ86E_19660 [Bradyrhizobium betae]|uniref:hypothetical protein n=1 Tax=Bradyrhizobium betae TaxID=244734 RepID=UPI003D664C33
MTIEKSATSSDVRLAWITAITLAVSLNCLPSSDAVAQTKQEQAPATSNPVVSYFNKHKTQWSMFVSSLKKGKVDDAKKIGSKAGMRSDEVERIASDTARVQLISSPAMAW